ncbi:putative phage-related tail protein [Neisseria zoodegmatis]|uniref:Putative phage-related tail protein n=1 Tax=Neisseria zoodegmatis TaxID=326523 RepID=A0A378WGZ2_9NEIS|nr:phage tail tape measure protein [Neisseria zoodegmatis]SUA36352.1 putative phage-related tail protein [Neisseria zoodegmatis]
MANGLALSITIGASVGAAIAGIKTVGSSLKYLEKTTESLVNRQKLLKSTLENPLRMNRQRVGELRREYVELGKVIDKINAKRANIASLQQQRQQHYDNRGKFKDELFGAVAAAGSIAVPVRLAVDFESAMADVRKVVDFDTPQQFKQMQQDILKLTRTIPMAGKELAVIAASGGQLGVARQDIIGFTEQIAKMSVAFDMSADEAGDSMAKLANVYKIPIKNIGILGDAINHLSNQSPAKASDIVNALGRVGGVAKQFGLTELQTTSLANAFISLGKTPEIAGTAINGMLTKLMTADKQGKKFQAVLNGMGTDAKALKKAIAQNGEQALVDFMKQLNKLPKEQQMGALVDLFGLEYADDIAVLAGSIETYEKSIAALKNTTKDGKQEFIGSMNKEFQARAATTAANWQTMKNHLIEIGITVGNALLPAINDLLSAVKPMISAFADWAAKNPSIVSGIVYMVAGLASLKVGSLAFRFALNEWRGFMVAMKLGKALLGADWLATVLRFKSGVGLLAKGFVFIKKAGFLFIKGFMTIGRLLLANPIFLALGLLAAAAYLLYQNWDGVVGGAKALWQDLGNFVGGIADAVGNFFNTAWQNIKAFFNSGIANISATIINWSPLGLFYQAFAAVMNWFGFELPAKFTEFGANIISGLWNGLKAKLEAVKAWFGGVAGWFAGKFQTANQIHSPSRLFHRFGGWMMEGLQLGLNKGVPRPLTAIGNAAGRLKERFTDRMGQLRGDIAARVSAGGATFAAERERQAAAATGGMVINYNPTINAPGGDTAQIQTALSMSQREFEMMFKRMMADIQRKAY